MRLRDPLLPEGLPDLSMANYQICLPVAVFEVLIRLPGWRVLKDALF
jgi:hypothetical protein